MVKKLVVVVVLDPEDADDLTMPENSWHVQTDATEDELRSGRTMDDLSRGFEATLARRRIGY